MIRPLVAAATLAIASAAPSVARADAHGTEAAQPLLVEVGAPAFRQYCASCHGLDAAGGGPVARALRTPPADLTRIAARRGGSFPDGDVAAFIDGRFELDAHGTREMPIWGRRLAEPIADDTTGDEVARGRIQILVEYLKSIQVAD